MPESGGAKQCFRLFSGITSDDETIAATEAISVSTLADNSAAVVLATAEGGDHQRPATASANASPMKNSLIDARSCTKPEKKGVMTNSQLWFRGVRPSKFRHVYGLPSRKESCYTDISLVRNGNDGNFCAVNPTFLAIVADTSFVVIPIAQTGRIDFQCCKVIGHTGQILDLKWNPFNDHIIASASDDCTIRIWTIAEGGLTENLTDSDAELCGHKRKVLHLEWHPTAANVLVSAGFDHLIIVWDVSEANAILKVITCHTDMIYSLAINRDGSLMATTSKDKKLRVFEPRTGIIIAEGVCHAGTKCSKAIFLDNNKILTTGFTRHSDRQYTIWDQHDLKKPLVQEVIDSSSGVVTPYYDFDTKMLYLAGKGDGNIRYYEMVDAPPYIHYLNQFLSGQPQKALGFMPKRGMTVGQCEVYRFYKLHAAGNICEPISMIVPRKSTLFQADLYPDTLAAMPALSARDWMTGRNAQPMLVSMQTGEPALAHCCNVNGGDTELSHDQKYAENNGNKENNVVDNNSKKFAFLSQQTIPDYRPQALNDKNQKTSTNQSTKFHQLQAMFGQQANIKEIQNNLLNNVAVSVNNSLENLNDINSENELRKTLNRQSDEIKALKKQLAVTEKRCRDLEAEVTKLQMR